MILIADSGSTKTEWCVADGTQVLATFRTAGMNPYLQTGEAMRRELAEALFPALTPFPIDAVHFYGAGCAFPEKNRIVAEAIRSGLPLPVTVDSDLLGAARALCRHTRGIACILGTGSNSCLYDGQHIIRHIPPLGFILGDEGSGSALGKRLVGDCLKGQLPPHLREQFLTEYRLDEATILERVYRQPFPNRFLAGLSPFLADHREEPALHRLLLDSFRSFLLRNVLPYEGSRETAVHCVGSIAYFYREELREAADALRLTLAHIERSPLAGLVHYHAARPSGTPAPATLSR